MGRCVELCACPPWGDASADAPADAPVEAEAGGGPSLRLFDGHSPGGILGGRAGADGLCATAAQGDAGPLYPHVRALLSVSGTDEISDMPSNYGVPTSLPVRSPTGQTVASSWADLLDGTLAQSLGAAGVFQGTFWYSGSNANGTLATQPIDGGSHPLTCSGWTDGNTLFDAEYGVSNTTGSGWIATSQATCGLSSYHVLCLGW